MDARFYNNEDIDVQRLANDLVNAYIAQGYQTQQFGDKNQMLVQLKKGGDLEALIGMQAALSLTLQRTAGGTLAMIGQQRWLDKAAVGTIGIVAFPILWPLALTAGAGAIRQASLANQVLNMVDGLVRQQQPNVLPGPIPVQFLPQVQQQWGPAPYQQTPAYIPSQGMPQPLPMPTKLRCPNCNTPYEPGDTFCTGCGHSLTPQKSTCPNCHTELKPGVAFCPKCGASTFQSATGAQAPVAPPQHPAQQAPYYAPPVQPVQPAQPVQAPKPQPKPPTPYYVPSTQAVPMPAEQPTMNPYAAPTVAAPTPVPQPKPAPEPYYTPAVTQEPSVQPQPKVTLVPNTNQAAAAPASAPKQPPQKQYYIPTNQAAAQPSTAQAPATPQPLQAQPASDPNAPWGSLSFSDGKQVQLAGEHAVVGRYDHDLGGLQPEVDLADMQESNTVSRVHAALEHIGSIYTLTDLNSTNATRINGKRLEPDKAMPINDGDTLSFGKITCTFKKLS